MKYTWENAFLLRAQYGQAGKLVLDPQVMPGLAQKQAAAAHLALPTELLGLSYITSAVTVAPGDLNFLLHTRRSF